MPNDATYTISELADLAGVTPRTIRYYLAQGLLPATGQSGPGTRYTSAHLARLRLVRRLQAEHQPLAEIRTRLARLDDDAVVALAEQDAPEPPQDSALDYVRSILGTAAREDTASYQPPAPVLARRSLYAPMVMPAVSSAPPPEERLGESHHSTVTAGDRSQWERIVLATDVELHIRRPLSRTQNKRVDRLVTIARELLEEDPS
jgi:DNA-binding transcriptional MerR regulator